MQTIKKNHIYIRSKHIFGTIVGTLNAEINIWFSALRKEQKYVHSSLTPQSPRTSP